MSFYGKIYNFIEKTLKIKDDNDSAIEVLIDSNGENPEFSIVGANGITTTVVSDKAIEIDGSSLKISLTEAGNASDNKRTYTLKQGDKQIGSKIEVPVVSIVNEVKVENDNLVITFTGGEKNKSTIKIPLNDILNIDGVQLDAKEIQLAIGDNDILSATIVNGAITKDKIADNAITAAKIASNAVTNTEIQDGAVTTAKIENGAINKDKLSDDLFIVTGTTLTIGG